MQRVLHNLRRDCVSVIESTLLYLHTTHNVPNSSRSVTSSALAAGSLDMTSRVSTMSSFLQSYTVECSRLYPLDGLWYDAFKDSLLHWCLG